MSSGRPRPLQMLPLLLLLKVRLLLCMVDIMSMCNSYGTVHEHALRWAI